MGKSLLNRTMFSAVCQALLLALALAASAQGKRIAVVIGVSNYQHGYALLDYAGSDAERIARALRVLDYKVNLRAADADTGEGVLRSDVVRALKAAVGAVRESD